MPLAFSLKTRSTPRSAFTFVRWMSSFRSVAENFSTPSDLVKARALPFGCSNRILLRGARLKCAPCWMHYLSAVDTSASPKLATDHQKAKDAATVSCSVANGIAVGCGPCSRAFSRSVCSARTRRGHSSVASCSACALDADAAMTFELEHGFANLGDVTIHYVTAGRGPPIVLIHGWPQTWYMWRDIMPGLAHRYRVIAPDLRGFGESSRPVAGYDKKTMSDDLWRLAQGVLGESRLFVVGHDWGGPTAFALTAQHRDAVRRMAIFDAPVPGDGTPVMFNNRWHHALHWELDFPEAITAGREDIYLGFFYRNWGARPDAISLEAQREYIRAYRLPGAMRAGFNLYRTTPQDVADNESFLRHGGKLQMPVLCYGGPLGRGRGMGAIESWRRVAEDVRGGIAEACGHWIPEERPDWVIQQLLAFFAEAND